MNIGLGSSGESGYPGTNGGTTSVSMASATITARGGFGGGGSGTVVTGGDGGTADIPGNSLLYKDGGTDKGQSGTSGDRSNDIRSEGGSAGKISNKGSVPSFGGGVGAIRARGGNTQSAGNGGGGSGGYNSGYGAAGGNGQVIIMMRYYAEE